MKEERKNCMIFVIWKLKADLTHGVVIPTFLFLERTQNNNRTTNLGVAWKIEFHVQIWSIKTLQPTIYAKMKLAEKKVLIWYSTKGIVNPAPLIKNLWLVCSTFIQRTMEFIFWHGTRNMYKANNKKHCSYLLQDIPFAAK